MKMANGDSEVCSTQAVQAMKDPSLYLLNCISFVQYFLYISEIVYLPHGKLIKLN